jgi:hypothetical protein
VMAEQNGRSEWTTATQQRVHGENGMVRWVIVLSSATRVKMRVCAVDWSIVLVTDWATTDCPCTLLSALSSLLFIFTVT